MTKLAYTSVFALCLGAWALPASAQDAKQCGRLSIAEMNWSSAGVAAWVDKIILENGYSCQIDLVTGDTMPTFTSMNEKGEPDIAPELWVNAVKEPLDNALKEGRLVQAAEILSDGGVEGWWIPKYVADAHPDIKTVADALKHPELFPAPEHPDRGGVMNCPSGWNCQITTTNLFKRKMRPTRALIWSIADRPQGWMVLSPTPMNASRAGWGITGAPTAILGKYDMVKLPFEQPLDVDHYTTCIAVPDCPDPKVTEYPVADVYTVVTQKLAENNPMVMDYLGKRSWKNDIVNQILAWKDDNQATNEDAAWHFLETYPEVWKPWLGDDAAQKVADQI